MATEQTGLFTKRKLVDYVIAGIIGALVASGLGVLGHHVSALSFLAKVPVYGLGSIGVGVALASVGVLLIREAGQIERRVPREPPPTLPEGERGLWDFRRDGERAVTAMGEIAQEMTRSMDKQSKDLNRHTRRITRAARRGVDVEHAYALSEEAARDTNQHAAKLEELEARLRRERVSMIQNLSDWFRGQPADAEIGEQLTALTGLADAMAQAQTGAKSYRDSVIENRRQNTSQPMNQATDRLAAVLSKVIEDHAATEQFCRNPLGRSPDA